LSEACARRAGLALAAGVALLCGACSMSFPMNSLLPEDPPTTASVEATKPASPLSPELGAEDWRRARGALAVALDPQGSGSPVSWENPDTAIRGHFTPVGQPFVKSDEICRAFLATVDGQASTASLQGTACRPSGGEWAIKDVKPFRKPA
jgi:surface antigen